MSDLSANEIDELLSVLHDREMDGPRGFTVKEICEAKGWSKQRARDSLRPLVTSGKLRPQRVPRGTADGYLVDTLVNGYVRVA